MQDTVKPVFNDHPWVPKRVAVVDWWSFFRGHLSYKNSKCGPKKMVVVSRWSLFGGGR